MSIEPKCPKILKAKLSKNKEITSSTKNISCWQQMLGYKSSDKSPIKTLQKLEDKQNKILAYLKQGGTKIIGEVQKHKEYVRSISPIPFQLNGSVQKRPYISPNKTSLKTPKHIQNQIQIQRNLEYSEKQTFYLKTQIDQLQQIVRILEHQNKSLRERNTVLERKKVEGDKLIVMYNQKFNETEGLKNSLSSLHQMIFKQQKTIENIQKHEVKQKKQLKQTNQDQKTKIADDIILGFKQFKTHGSIVSQSKCFSQHYNNTNSNLTNKQFQISSQFSLKGKQTGFTSSSYEDNLLEEMKKLRSVYEKPKSSFSSPDFKKIVESEELMEVEQDNQFNRKYIESEIQELKLDDMISVEGVEEASNTLFYKQ